MKGWSELLLCGVVLAACWTRTPIGDLGHLAAGWVRGEPGRTDLLASFRTDLPVRLEEALGEALAEGAPGPAVGGERGRWTPALETAITAHLGAEALVAIRDLDIPDPEAAIEVWAVGPELRDRAIDRARAAGASEPERLASHAPYLPSSSAQKAQSAVSDTLSLATVLDLAWPVDPAARISSGFGYRTHPTLKTRKLHEGVDIAIPVGTPVHAAGASRVSRAREDKFNGKHVILDHGHRVTTAYCHGDALRVTQGEQVERGQLILDSGNTGRSSGPHLHFGLRVAGRAVDPGAFRDRAAAAPADP